MLDSLFFLLVYYRQVITHFCPIYIRKRCSWRTYGSLCTHDESPTPPRAEPDMLLYNVAVGRMAGNYDRQPSPLAGFASGSQRGLVGPATVSCSAVTAYCTKIGAHRWADAPRCRLRNKTRQYAQSSAASRASWWIAAAWVVASSDRPEMFSAKKRYITVSS